MTLREVFGVPGCVGLEKRAEGEYGVEAAEGEGVRESQFWCGFARLAEDDVEIECGVDLCDSGVGGEEIFAEANDGGEGFEGSAGSDGVAVERFGGADGNF
jgi:hypothetical protein